MQLQPVNSGRMGSNPRIARLRCVILSDPPIRGIGPDDGNSN